MLQNLLVAVLVLCSGCSIYPYKERFACENLNDYGRCLDVKGAYSVATTGVMQGEPVKKGAGLRSDKKKAEQGSVNNVGTEQGARSQLGQDALETQRYTLLKQNVDNPKLPVVKQPKVVRTLILNYSDHLTVGSPLYGHRYVYFFGSDPQWEISPFQRQQQSKLLPTIVK